jgi:hypothetical protein
MHQHNGLCLFCRFCLFWALCGNRHAPADTESYLDAIFFSPHKFLGGPGTSGVFLIKIIPKFSS